MCIYINKYIYIYIYTYIYIYIYMYVYVLEGGGVSPTGKSFRFVRACERARRGEAAWAGERNDPSVARAKSGQMFVPLPPPCGGRWHR